MVGDDDSVGAEPDPLARVLGVEDALDDQRPVPVRADPADVGPGDRGIEIAPDPADIIVEPAGILQHRKEVAEAVRPAPDADVPGPARMAEDLAEASPAPAHQPGMDVAVARARHRQVDGEHQSGALDL